MASGSTSSNVVGVHYRVGKKIGEGSFGVIFEGTNLLNQQQVAIKFEPRKSDAPQLRDEYRTYKILVGCRECFSFPLYHMSSSIIPNHDPCPRQCASCPFLYIHVPFMELD
jgi:serine/threonine protein kinase